MLKGVLNLFRLNRKSKQECSNSKSLRSVIDESGDTNCNKVSKNAVKCINSDTGVEYASISAAAKAEGISRSSAMRLVKGEYECINGVRLTRL